MAKERKKVEQKEVIPEVKIRVEPKKYVKPEPKRRETKEEPIIEIPEPSPKKTRTKKIIEPEKKLQTKPIIEKTLPVKKLSKKEIEREKLDNSVPQLPVKKQTDIMMVPSTPKIKRSEDKYISLAENANMEDRKLLTDRIIKNEIVFSHYAIDNEIGFHYYRILNN